MIVPSKDVEIIFVRTFYDWPLAGDGRYGGRVVSFQREDFDSEDFDVEFLNRVERLRAWLHRTAFGVCIGWHWHYKNGTRSSSYRPRKPKWLRSALHNTYFYGRPWRRKRV